MKKNKTKAMAMATITALTMCVTSTTSAYAGYFPDNTWQATKFNDLFDKYPIMIDAWKAYEKDPINVEFMYRYTEEKGLFELGGRPVVNGQYADGNTNYVPSYSTTEDNRYVYETYTMVDETGITEDYIKTKIAAFKLQYPKYTTWTNDNYYSTIYTGIKDETSLFAGPKAGWGCAGFSGLMYDFIYQDISTAGNNGKVYLYNYYNEILFNGNTNFNTYEYKVGDEIRIGNISDGIINASNNQTYSGTHTIVITDINRETGIITYSEGNTNGQIWHDSTITVSDLRAKTVSVLSAFKNVPQEAVVTPEVNAPVTTPTTPEQYITVGGVQVTMSDLLAALQSLQ